MCYQIEFQKLRKIKFQPCIDKLQLKLRNQFYDNQFKEVFALLLYELNPGLIEPFYILQNKIHYNTMAQCI